MWEVVGFNVFLWFISFEVFLMSVIEMCCVYGVFLEFVFFVVWFFVVWEEDLMFVMLDGVNVCVILGDVCEILV